MALSEFADTLQSILPLVEASTLIDETYLSPILPQLAQFTGNLLPFERASESSPTVKNSTAFLHALVEENDLDSFFEKAFELGGALLTTSLNYLVIRDLARDPEAYADRLAPKDVHTAFKESGKLSDLRDLFVHGHPSTAGKTKRPGGFADLLAQLDDPVPPVEGPASSSGRTVKRQLSTDSSASHPTSSPRKKVKKHKKVILEDF